MAKKVVRYRSKLTQRYISRAQYLREKKTSVRSRERYVKGTRKKETALQKLIRTSQEPVIVRKRYKAKGKRNYTYIELIYEKGSLNSAQVGFIFYDRAKDLEALQQLINASEEYDGKGGPKTRSKRAKK